MGKNRWSADTGYRYTGNEKPLGTQGVKVNRPQLLDVQV
jgi:hypothetical protein